MNNPLFPDDPETPDSKSQQAGYVLPRSKERVLQPASGQKGAEQAADLIRQKIKTLYTVEPEAEKELKEVAATTPRSKHQQFMYELSTSGKSLAHIQTAWHEYYIGLPDAEKHTVWQEFYAANERQPSAYTRFVQQKIQAETAPKAPIPIPVAHPSIAVTGINPSTGEAVGTPVVSASPKVTDTESPNLRTAAAIRKQVLKKVKVSEVAQRRAKQHLQSLLFGISMGTLALVVVLFSFFNEVIITPFIQPSRHDTTTPVILSSDDISATSAPEVIIPKINVEIPTNFSLTTDDENAIENALEDGVVHYPSTVMPGQAGNTAFFGHSSNNIFNPGKYKFAFVLLHTLVPGDIFYLTYNGTVYTYKVYDKQIVSPSDVAVLDNVPGKTATATLITCDPPGTSLDRLVVWGEQISPDPSGNAIATPTATTTAPTQLADNGPSLWNRFVKWLF